MSCDYRAEYSQYKAVSILGDCGWGSGNVYLSKYAVTGQMVAIKRISVDRILREEAFLKEILLTKQLRHPNILQYLTTFVHDQDVCIVTPLMGYGSCRDLINNHFHDGLSESAIAIILRDVFEGLDYIHRNGIIHRAIRASHVLVSASGQSCLSGFRYSTSVMREGKRLRSIFTFPCILTPNLNWVSPEVLEQNRQGYNEKSDIYSVGMLISELANGSEPFKGDNTTLMLIDKIRGSVPELLDCTTLPAIDPDVNEFGFKMPYDKQAARKFSDNLHEITKLCFQKQPECRPSAMDFLTHPFFKTIRRSPQLSELLKPVIPLGDNVVWNGDELEAMAIRNRMSEMKIFSCEWDFCD